MLVPHRAIYDLSLGETRGNSQIAGVRGRIVYDFDGNACEGYSLEFRQVSELDTGEGKVSTSDLRSTTWEGADAKSFKFTSQNFVDREPRRFRRRPRRARRQQDRRRSRQAAAEDPRSRRRRRISDRAHGARDQGRARRQDILDFPVYDGSETGDKVFDTLTVIGRKIAPDERNHDDAAANEPKLAAVPRWPVTISYFDQGQDGNNGEQTPAYAIGFELYENGISRALTLDYNDFVVSGKLISLEFKEQKPCP